VQPQVWSRQVFGIVWGTRAVSSGISKSKSTLIAHEEVLEHEGEMTTEPRSSNLITHINSGIHNDEIPDPTGKLIQWFNMPMPQSAAASFDQPNESFEEKLIGDSLDLQSQQSCPPFGFEYNFTSSTQIGSAFNPIQDNTERLIGSENGGLRPEAPQQMARRRCVPPSLPFLIFGLESSLHLRLFITSPTSCPEY
jgi:hypothetical protein